MSKNVWKDLGRSDAEQIILKQKAQYWNEILEKVEESELTQVELAKLWGTKQPNVSKIIRGKLDDVSIDLLVFYLASLGLTEVKLECRYGA